jgi:hypothetical protein
MNTSAKDITLLAIPAIVISAFVALVFYYALTWLA